MGLGLEVHKYLASASWAPVVLFVAGLEFGRSNSSWPIKVLLTVAVIQLIVAGSIYFQSYLRMSNSYAASLAPSTMIDEAEAITPGTKRAIVGDIILAQRFGQMAAKVAFPLMTLGYAEVALVALLTLWGL